MHMVETPQEKLGEDHPDTLAITANIAHSWAGPSISHTARLVL